MATTIQWARDWTPGSCDINGQVYKGTGPTTTTSGDIQSLPDGVAQALFDAGYVALTLNGYWYTRNGVCSLPTNDWCHGEVP